MIKYILIFFTNLLFAPAFSQELVLTTPLQDQCSKESIVNWDSITNYFHGAAGTGFIGKDEWIGLCETKYHWGGPWKPIDGYKHTLCGNLTIKKKKNSSYHFISEGDGDLVFYVRPDSAFQWLLSNSLRPKGHYFIDAALACETALKEKGKTVDTNGSIYFQKSLLDSIQNKPAGVYGAWVSDVHHEKSPEIHPVQQMWIVEQMPNDILEYKLYSMLDNSSRFKDEDDFPVSCFLKTWMPIPLINVFYIPFSISLNADHQYVYDITMMSSNNTNLFDSTENQLRLVINGSSRLIVNRPGNAYPKVTFIDVCQENENTIHGYLAVETSIGKVNSKNGGHAYLKMLRTKKVLSDSIKNKN